MIYTLPFIAAVIGWFTNFLAVKMLFHPKEKKRILSFEIQGIFPKRQKALARKLGALVARELISFDEIKEKLIKEENLDGVMELIDERITEFLEASLQESSPFLAAFMSEKKKTQLKQVALDEIKEVLPEAIETYIDKAKENLDVEKIVFEKVAAFSSDKLEAILFGILKKEFRFIEIVGGVLGFVIGLIQLLLVHLTI